MLLTSMQRHAYSEVGFTVFNGAYSRESAYRIAVLSTGEGFCFRLEAVSTAHSEL